MYVGYRQQTVCRRLCLFICRNRWCYWLSLSLSLCTIEIIDHIPKYDSFSQYTLNCFSDPQILKIGIKLINIWPYHHLRQTHLASKTATSSTCCFPSARKFSLGWNRKLVKIQARPLLKVIDKCCGRTIQYPRHCKLLREAWQWWLGKMCAALARRRCDSLLW